MLENVKWVIAFLPFGVQWFYKNGCQHPAPDLPQLGHNKFIVVHEYKFPMSVKYSVGLHKE